MLMVMITMLIYDVLAIDWSIAHKRQTNSPTGTPLPSLIAQENKFRDLVCVRLMHSDTLTPERANDTG